MNPWGILFVGLGLIMIIVGFKGSQHSVITAFKGATGNVVSGGTATQQTPSAPGQTTPGTGRIVNT